MRTYKKPESHPALYSWIFILRAIIACSLSLLYNIKWTDESIFSYLEPTIVKLYVEGNALALRQLMQNLGIKLAQDEPYPAEMSFEKLNFLQIQQFGSFYWRFLHWMAEADAIRSDDSQFYKIQWREILKGPLYRTLRCPICMIHFEKMMAENKAELSTINSNLPQLFFKLHNQTHAYRRETFKFLQEPDYTEEMYEKDAEFMRRALVQS